MLIQDILRYKFYIFDCDGVILDSNQIKTESFKETLSDFEDDLVNKFIEYHKNNGGISRFTKFKFFYENIIGLNKNQNIDELLNKFNKIVFSKLCNANFIPGVISFIELLKKNNKKIYVVSGGLEKEIKEVFIKKNIYILFDEIFGSPTEKDIHTKKIISINKNEHGVFFGDSKLDFDVANDNYIDFVFIREKSEWLNYNQFTIKNIIENFNHYDDLFNL